MYNYIIYLIKVVQILLQISSILLFLFNIFILNQFFFFIINFYYKFLFYYKSLKNKIEITYNIVFV